MHFKQNKKRIEPKRGPSVMKLPVGALDSSAGLSRRYGGGLWFLAAGSRTRSLVGGLQGGVAAS